MKKEKKSKYNVEITGESNTVEFELNFSSLRKVWNYIYNNSSNPDEIRREKLIVPYGWQWGKLVPQFFVRDGSTGYCVYYNRA